MKTERRHDLETNDLARHAAVWIEKCKPYASQIFGTIIVIFGLVILVSLWGTSTNVKEQAAWDAYARELRLDDQEMFGLQKVSDDQAYAGTAMQDWAKVTSADRQMARASYQFFIDRETSVERLEAVAEVYEELIETSKDEEIRNRARYGLGRTHELRNQLDDARQQYESVTGSFELLARSRLEKLNSPDAEEIYQWLTTAKLPKREGSEASGAKPAFEAELPSSGFDASSVEDILGGSGDDSEDADSTNEEAEDKTEQPMFELDDIFLDEGTEGGAAEGDVADESPAEGETSEDESEAEAETAEP